MRTQDRAPNFNRELLAALVRGAEKTFKNAEALFHEAKLLGAAGALSRSLFLHQISLEECAKIEIIGAWATSLLAGMPINDKKVLAALTRHANKNRTNAYMLDGSAEEAAAKEKGDWEGALAEFKKFQNEFHVESNEAKNASLYVDFANGEFVAPMDRITADLLVKTAERNETFLGLMFPKVEMLLGWEKAPDDIQETMIAFVQRAEALRAEMPDDPQAAIEKLLGEFLAEGLAKSRRKGTSGADPTTTPQ